MTHKVTVGLQQKIGQPNFGSLGASCAIELPIDDAEFAEPGLLAARIQYAYTTCQQSVAGELARCATQAEQADRADNAEHANMTHTADKADKNEAAEAARMPDRRDSNPRANGHRADRQEIARHSRPATGAQVRALHAIARKHDVALLTLIRGRFGVHSPDQLTLTQASQLIDQLDQLGDADAGQPPSEPATT